MKRFKPVLLLLIAAAIALAVFAWFRLNPNAATEDGALVLYGNVEIREVQLAFNGSEHLNRVLVDEGDKVTQGQLLASLHTARLKASLDRARSAVEAQRQVLAALEAGTRPEEIRKAEAELAAAKAEALSAAQTLKRVRALAKTKVASQESLDEAEAADQAAKARVKATEAALELAQAGPRQEDIAAARATLHAMEAERDLAEETLKDAQLYAPADGVIRDRILEPGDMVTPQSPVFTLALIDPVWVRAYVPETRLGQVRPGMAADIESDSYPGKHYRGWVGYISPSAEFTPKTVETPDLRTRLVYRMRVYVCNPQEELRLGMPVTVHLQPGAPDAGNQPCRSDHAAAQRPE